MEKMSSGHFKVHTLKLGLWTKGTFDRSSQNLKLYGELAERSKAAVLKTVEVRASWGSNP